MQAEPGAVSEPPAIADSGHVAALAGLRALAALAVVGLDAQLHSVHGGIAVETFMVLSGFLITGLLLAERSRNGGIDYSLFLVRRAIRIVPPLLITTGVSSAALVLAFPRMARSIETQALHGVTFTMDRYAGAHPDSSAALGHLWSLAVEGKFYLVWPGLLAGCLWLTRRRPTALPLLLMQLAILGYAEPALRYAPTPGLFPPVSVEADARTGGLLLGCAAAVALRQHPALRVWFGRWWVGVISLAVLTGLVFHPGVVGTGQRLETLLGLPVAGLASVLLVAHLASTSRGATARLLGSPPLAWTGERSYSLYLWQLPVLVILIGRYHLRPLPALVVGFVISLALAALMKVCVEVPAAAYSARLSLAWSSRRSRRVRLTTLWSARLSLASALATAIAVGVASRARTVDDGDIVLRYVHNLLDGRGWVWNTGSVRNACTSFLHPLLIVLLEITGARPTAAVTIVGTFGLALAACSAVVLLRRLQLPFAAVVAGVALPLLPIWRETWGLETPLYVGLLLAYAAVATSGRASPGLVAAISLTRPDGILVLGPALLRARREGRTRRFLLMAVTPVVILAVVALARTGSPLPASVAAKKAQGTSGALDGFHYLPVMLRYLDTVTESRSLTWVILALGALALAAVIQARLWAVVDLVFVTVAQTLIYAALNVPGYYWYYVPALVVLGIVLLCGAELSIRALVSNRATRRSVVDRPTMARQFAMGVLTLGTVAAVVQGISLWAPGDNLVLQPREASYFAVARWMASQGPVRSIAVSEVGVIGVALPDARIDDLIGLTTAPGAAPGPDSADLLADPPQWILVHFTLGGAGGYDKLAAPQLRRSAAEAHISLSDIGFGTRSSAISVWAPEGGILRAPAFDRTYRMVRVWAYPGDAPLGVFEVRDGRSAPGLSAAQ